MSTLKQIAKSAKRATKKSAKKAAKKAAKEAAKKVAKKVAKKSTKQSVSKIARNESDRETLKPISSAHITPSGLSARHVKKLIRHVRAIDAARGQLKTKRRQLMKRLKMNVCRSDLGLLKKAIATGDMARVSQQKSPVVYHKSKLDLIFGHKNDRGGSLPTESEDEEPSALPSKLNAMKGSSLPTESDDQEDQQVAVEQLPISPTVSTTIKATFEKKSESEFSQESTEDSPILASDETKDSPILASDETDFLANHVVEAIAEAPEILPLDFDIPNDLAPISSADPTSDSLLSTPQADDAEECIVCFGCLQDPLVLKGYPTNCGHTFCAPCIVSWIHSSAKKNDSISCPLCREEVVSVRIGDYQRGIPERYVTTEEVMELNTGDMKLWVKDEFGKGSRDVNLFVLPPQVDRVSEPIVHSESEEEVCATCHAFDETEKIICDNCNKIYHMACAGLRPPPHSQLPRGAWYCDGCWGEDNGEGMISRRYALVSDHVPSRRQFDARIRRDRQEYNILRQMETVRLTKIKMQQEHAEMRVALSTAIQCVGSRAMTIQQNVVTRGNGATSSTRGRRGRNLETSVRGRRTRANRSSTIL